MPWGNDTADGWAPSPASGDPGSRHRVPVLVDPFARNRAERRIAAFFFTGMLCVCAAILWLFHGADLVRWFMLAGGAP
ncbi:MAG TPA: hypothetical protein PK379_06730 [Candidatus Hydrogenedentes bacterium]|nr:hypothetical protein [Candidatus Hydrogenedentota bacterium]HOJ69198.1 hypothetical protein [Candidatus Hydrogenedentota bacterium]HOK89704.1 hypothetical protein [Candidatus Hydrogenedentota bacterium]